MKEIKLSQGKVALVDDEDYEYLNQWEWHAAKNGNTYYAGRYFKINGKQTLIKMHRLIANTPDGLIVDHIDHNGLNNQKSNLRNCTPQENCFNSIAWGISKYKGVRKSGNKFRSSIYVNNKEIYLGVFDREEDAAIAYNEAVKKYRGEFANINQLVEILNAPKKRIMFTKDELYYLQHILKHLTEYMSKDDRPDHGLAILKKYRKLRKENKTLIYMLANKLNKKFKQWK